MIVYKITNMVNNKIYIGQTSKTIEERLKKHYSARNENCVAYNIPIRRALRKYDDLSLWKIEELHSNLTKEEADKMEELEILNNNSTNSDIGYNIAIGAIGGNTLSNHPNLDKIKEKISQSKMGGKNPNAKSVILKNDASELIFGSAEECKRYLETIDIIVASSTIKRKCNGIIKNNKIGEYHVCWNKV